MSVETLESQEIIGDLLFVQCEGHPAAWLWEHMSTKNKQASLRRNEFSTRAAEIIAQKTSATEANGQFVLG